MFSLLYYLLVFMIPMPDNPWWAWSVGTLTGMKIVGIACLLAAIVYLATSRRWPPFVRLTSGKIFVFLFFVAFLSDLLRHGIVVGPTVLYNDLAVVSLFVVTLVFVNSPERLRKVALVAMGSVAFDSLYVIRQWQGFHNVYGGFRGWGGVAGDPNYYAVSVVLWLPALLFWIEEKRPRWEKLYCWGCLALIVVGFSISASRGGLLGLGAALLLFIAYSRHRLRYLVIFVILVVSMSAFTTTSPVSRLLHPDKSDKESSLNREELWRAGMKSFREHPLIGVGVGGFHPKTMKNGVLVDLPFHVAHNTYIDYLVNLGLAGFLPFVGLLIACVWSLGRVARKLRQADSPPMLYQLARGIQAGVVGYMVSAFFLTTWWQQVFWLSVFLSMCLPFLNASLPRRRHPFAIQAEPDESYELHAHG